MPLDQAFDVFLSYSRADFETVRQVQTRLREAGLATFLDRDQLPAGQPWLSALEQAIAHCGAVAVLIGPAGLGTWQQREIQLALDRQAEAERVGHTFPVIPILLPKVEDPPGGFLRLQTWVDLRADLGDPAQLHLLLTSIRGQAPADGSALREVFCPYRGLLPFREEDAGLFFGRERETEELVDKLRQHSFITLVGRSGSGKSSVVYAGLIPALRRRADGRTWSILSLRPGPEPLHALVRAFDPPRADLPPFEAHRRVEQQVEILRTMDGALGRHIRSLLAGPSERGTDRFLLHVDQWEELYTQALRRSASTPEQAEADVARFIDLLLDATRTSPCTVVVTVRADFYGELLKHGPLAAAIPSGLVNLGPMRREGLTAAIQEPARAVGLTVDPPLLEELLNEVCDDLGKLPLLEYALKETWHGREGQRLTLNAYGRSGGIDGAVAMRANEIFARLKPSEQAAARRLFVSLVTPGEGREDTRARALYPEQDEAIRAVVHEFSAADARLLVTGADIPTGQHLVEISHEALIREWGLLREWVGANREALRRREHIRARMRQWEEQGRDATLLLSPGLPLEEGRKLLTDHGDVLIEDIKPYIEASIAADEERLSQAARQRQRRTTMAVAASMFVTALAITIAWQWHQAEQRQEHIALVSRERDRLKTDFAAARQTIDLLLQDVSWMPTRTVRQLLVIVDQFYSNLAERSLDDLELQKGRAAMLTTLGDVYSRLGDLKLALQYYEQSLAITRRLAAIEPGNNEWQHQISLTLMKSGEIRRDRGDRAGALRSYEESLAILRRLLATNPDSAGWQSALSLGLSRIGDLQRDRGDRAGALRSYEESLVVQRRTVATHPDDAELQRELAVRLSKAGDAQQDTGNGTSALRLYEESLAIRRQLVVAHPISTRSQRDLAVGLSKVGDIMRSSGNRAGALRFYEESLAVQRQLASNPDDAGSQRDISVAIEKIGDLRLDAGDYAGAAGAYEETLAIRRRLAAADPNNAVWQHDLCGNLIKIGDLRFHAGDRAGALLAYEEGLAISRRLVAIDAGNAAWQFGLAISLASVSQASDDAEQKRAALQEAMRNIIALDERNALSLRQSAFRRLVQAELDRLPKR